MKRPKGIKGHRQKLFAEQCRTAAAMKRGMLEASRALDEQAQEISALKRILISERAQIIYYTELSPGAIDFLALPEVKQEEFVKRAIAELAGGAYAPHEPLRGVQCPKFLI